MSQSQESKSFYNPEFAYTIGSGKLYMDMSEFHRDAEHLLGRPILTHEFGAEETWDDLRSRLESELMERIQGRD